MKRFFSLFVFLMMAHHGTLLAETREAKPVWQAPSGAEQKYDWLLLTSDEWLKGDIIAMYDEKLEFDSDELGIVTIKWKDVAVLRSKSVQSLRFDNGVIVEGKVLTDSEYIYVDVFGQTKKFPNKLLLSIASSEENEADLWDGEISLGANLRKGNTEQLDYSFSAETQRRTSTSRFFIDYLSNFSESQDKGTGETKEIANSTRITSFYDWFFSQKMFFRAANFEYFSDELQNLDSRISFGIAVGYHVIDSKKTKWDIVLGPSYQQTQYITVEEGDEDKQDSSVLVVGTEFEYEITSDIDFETSYQVQFVSEESGEMIHHLSSGLEIDLGNDFELETTFYVDRTEQPQTEESGIVPEKDDYRFVVSLGYDF